jgi:hypothetical protein
VDHKSQLFVGKTCTLGYLSPRINLAQICPGYIHRIETCRWTAPCSSITNKLSEKVPITGARKITEPTRIKERASNGGYDVEHGTSRESTKMAFTATVVDDPPWLFMIGNRVGIVKKCSITI